MDSVPRLLIADNNYEHQTNLEQSKNIAAGDQLAVSQHKENLILVINQSDAHTNSSYAGQARSTLASTVSGQSNPFALSEKTYCQASQAHLNAFRFDSNFTEAFLQHSSCSLVQGVKPSDEDRSSNPFESSIADRVKQSQRGRRKRICQDQAKTDGASLLNRMPQNYFEEPKNAPQGTASREAQISCEGTLGKPSKIQGNAPSHFQLAAQECPNDLSGGASRQVQSDAALSSHQNQAQTLMSPPCSTSLNGGSLENQTAKPNDNNLQTGISSGPPHSIGGQEVQLLRQQRINDDVSPQSVGRQNQGAHQQKTGSSRKFLAPQSRRRQCDNHRLKSLEDPESLEGLGNAFRCIRQHTVGNVGSHTNANGLFFNDPSVMSCQPGVIEDQISLEMEDTEVERDQSSLQSIQMPKVTMSQNRNDAQNGNLQFQEAFHAPQMHKQGGFEMVDKPNPTMTGRFHPKPELAEQEEEVLSMSMQFEEGMGASFRATVCQQKKSVLQEPQFFPVAHPSGAGQSAHAGPAFIQNNAGFDMYMAPKNFENSNSMPLDEQAALQMRQNGGNGISKGAHAFIQDAFALKERSNAHVDSDVEMIAEPAQDKHRQPLKVLYSIANPENASHENAPPRRNRNDAPFYFNQQQQMQAPYVQNRGMNVQMSSNLSMPGSVPQMQPEVTEEFRKYCQLDEMVRRGLFHQQGVSLPKHSELDSRVASQRPYAHLQLRHRQPLLDQSQAMQAPQVTLQSNRAAPASNSQFTMKSPQAKLSSLQQQPDSVKPLPRVMQKLICHLNDDQDYRFQQENGGLRYKNSIHSWIKRTECKYAVHPNYLQKQPYFGAQERETLINWLMIIQVEFKLLPETLFITVNIIDRYLYRRHLSLGQLQLLGIAAMFIASKFQEIYPPMLSDLLIMTMNAFKQKHMLAMEAKVLMTLEFDVNCTPSQTFLENYSRETRVTSSSILIYASFLLDLALIKSEFLAFKTSHLTCCALAMALRRESTLKGQVESDELLYLKEIMQMEQFSEASFTECTRLFELLTSAAKLEESKASLTGLVRKYASTGVVDFPASLLQYIKVYEPSL